MQPGGLLVPGLVVAVALAGCLAAPEPVDPSALIDDAFAGLPRLGSSSDLPLLRASATLDAPPAWALGEWWTYRIESLLAGTTHEATRVVAGEVGASYLVGMPADKYEEILFIFHFPGLGAVNKTNLGFDAHDLFLQHLQFPLAEGATWTTQWYNGDPMEAVVTKVEGSRADVSLAHPVRAINLTYDAAVGDIVAFDVAGYLRYEVVDHGFGYQGEVRIPYEEDLVVCHGRANGVSVIDACAAGDLPGGPADTVVIGGDYDRLSFALILRGGAAPAPLPAPLPTQGLFALEVTAPDGKQYAAAKSPQEPGVVLDVYGHDDPLGAWEMRAFAGGVGSVLFEGAAYKVLDVTLGPRPTTP